MTCRTCHHDELKIRHHLAWIFIILIISMRNGQNSNHGIAELLMSPSYTHVLGPFLLWFDLRATIVNRAIIVWRVLWVDLVYWTKNFCCLVMLWVANIQAWADLSIDTLSESDFIFFDENSTSWIFTHHHFFIQAPQRQHLKKIPKLNSILGGDSLSFLPF